MCGWSATRCYLRGVRYLGLAIVLLTGCGLNDLGVGELTEAGADASATLDAGAGGGVAAPPPNPGVLLDGGTIPDEDGGPVTPPPTPPAPSTTCATGQAYCASKSACVPSCDNGNCSGSRSTCVTCGSAGTSPRATVCTGSYLCGPSNCGCTTSNDCPQRYEVCAAGKCVYCGGQGTTDKSCKGGGTCGPCGRFVYCHDQCGGGGGGGGGGGN